VVDDTERGRAGLGETGDRVPVLSALNEDERLMTGLVVLDEAGDWWDGGV
jgi:hypothetical protein